MKRMRFPMTLESGIGVDIESSDGDFYAMFWWNSQGDPTPEAEGILDRLNESAPTYQARVDAVEWVRELVYGSGFLE